jgi:hypothetical protein
LKNTKSIRKSHNPLRQDRLSQSLVLNQGFPVVETRSRKSCNKLFNEDITSRIMHVNVLGAQDHIKIDRIGIDSRHIKR